MTVVHLPLALIASTLWIGFVSAISFIEAWLKFKAPGVTIPLGLGIGRLVFNALNKIEWVLATLIICNLILAKEQFINPIKSGHGVFYLIPVFILLFQTVWLLPQLDARAQMHLNRQTVPPSKMHFVYVGLEIVKVVFLATFILNLFKNITT
ncbi:MAG: hypothetical protein ACO1G2_11535 [Bacteroidota bacterium]